MLEIVRQITTIAKHDEDNQLERKQLNIAQPERLLHKYGAAEASVGRIRNAKRNPSTQW